MDELEKLRKESERLEMLLFAVVRNNCVLPTGLRLGKSQKEITQMTYATIDSLWDMIDRK